MNNDNYNNGLPGEPLVLPNFMPLPQKPKSEEQQFLDLLYNVSKLISDRNRVLLKNDAHIDENYNIDEIKTKLNKAKKIAKKITLDNTDEKKYLLEEAMIWLTDLNNCIYEKKLDKQEGDDSDLEYERKYNSYERKYNSLIKGNQKIIPLVLDLLKKDIFTKNDFIKKEIGEDFYKQALDAIRNNNVEGLKALVDNNKVNPFLLNIAINQSDPKIYNDGKRNEEMTVFLIENNIDYYQADNNGNNALHWACEKGHKEVAELLIKKGIDINQKNNNGNTALHAASNYGHKEVAELLINNAINNIQDIYGYNALHYASREGHKEVAQLLIKNGTDIQQKNNNGNTALMLAAKYGKTEIVKALLKHPDIDVNKQDENGETALMLASRHGNTEIVKALLEHKNTDVNKQDEDGNNALHLAVKNGNKEIVKLLIEKGIDTNQQNKAGTTAINLADNDMIIIIMHAMRVGGQTGPGSIVSGGKNVKHY